MGERPRAWLLVLGALLFSGFVRLRLLDLPLERDEGDYAYIAQLLLQGVPLYTQAYEMRLPGVFGAYALALALFGESARGVHLGLWVVNAATLLLLFALGTRLRDATTGALAALAFAALSLHPGMHGMAANTEHFVLLPVLGGLLLLLRGLEKDRPLALLGAGLCLGAAFLTKQTALPFVLFGGLVALHTERGGRPRAEALRPALLFAAGAIALPLLCLVALWATGSFEPFWFWAVAYPLRYAAGVSPGEVLGDFRLSAPHIIGATWPLWLLAAAGSVVAWRGRRRFFLLGWLGFSALAVAAGLRLRPQHFLLLAPVAALLAALAATSAGRRWRPEALPAPWAAVALLVLAVASFAFAERDFLFRMDLHTASRSLYGANPFPESIEIARYIQEHTAPGDRIAVLGSEPQIYFYSRRRSASPFILTYELMADHDRAAQMQREMIEDLERNPPEYLVYVNVQSSWMRSANSPTRILAWYERRVPEHYTQVGRVDILSPTETRYRWEGELVGSPPPTGYWLAIWKRKPS